MHWALSAVIVFAAAAMLGRVMGLDEMILRLILPGDAAVTAAALETMVSELQSGEAIQEAFAGFCREIIDNAQIY